MSPEEEGFPDNKAASAEGTTCDDGLFFFFIPPPIKHDNVKEFTS